MEITYVGLPNNLRLPFFAYGNFKPGQLAYHRIEEYVEGEPSAEIIKHETKYRDGITFIVSKENETFKTSGYLIEFANPQDAYDEIGNSISDKLYEWKVIKVNGADANALVGLEENCGSFNNRDYNISTYDYRQDSFFNEALSLIGEIIRKFEGKNINTMEDFFIFQMHYMLLWSVIERFCTLSYGYFGIGDNMEKFADQNSFKNKLRTITRNDEVYSSDNLRKKFINRYNWKSIFYYYTIRCNVVHKGKAVRSKDRNKLKDSLEELYGLFMAVYNDKLIENDKILEKYPEKRIE